MKKVCKLANALRAEGVKKGDRPGFLVVWDGDSKSRFFFFAQKVTPPNESTEIFEAFLQVFFFAFFFC